MNLSISLLLNNLKFLCNAPGAHYISSFKQTFISITFLNLQKLETILCRASEVFGYKGPTNLGDIPDVSPDEITEYLSAFNELPGELSAKQIVRLAAVIAADNMPAIAEGYLDIGDAGIGHLQVDNEGHAEAFNRDILRKWTNMNCDDPNQVQVGI